MFIKDLAHYTEVLVGTCSTVINMIFLEKFAKKGILLTNMASAAKVTNF